MTLTKYSGQYEELFSNCVLWWTGQDQTSLGFPILPAGVTVTPNGTWSNDLNLGTSKTVKTFDGSTNYISLSDDTSWTFGTSDFSIVLWYRLSSIPSTTTFLWHLYTDAKNQMFSYFTQQTTPKYGPCFSVKISGTYVVDVVESDTLSTNTWYFMTWVRTGTSWLIYKNGIIVGSVTATVTVPDFTSGFNIGRDVATTSARVPGNLKDLMVFKNRALTQPEIITLMKKTHPTAAIGDFRPTLSGRRNIE